MFHKYGSKSFIATIWAKMEANDKNTAIYVNPYTFCITYMWLIGLDLYIINHKMWKVSNNIRNARFCDVYVFALEENLEGVFAWSNN